MRPLRSPQPQVLEDAPDDSRILDQRDHPHRPLALGAFQGIGLVHLADQENNGENNGEKTTGSGLANCIKVPAEGQRIRASSRMEKQDRL